MMRLTTVCTIILIAAGTASADIFVNDRAGWESAVAAYGYEEEFFDDAIFEPGVSVVTTYPGTVQAGSGVLGPDNVWWDRLTAPSSGGSTTTWNFAAPLVGFGAYWDPAGPGGPGMSIRMYLDGALVGQEINSNTSGSFWGVTNAPFDTVLLTTGSTSGWAETYEMDNMVYSVVPVPGAVLLGMLGLSVAGAKLRKYA